MNSGETPKDDDDKVDVDKLLEEFFEAEEGGERYEQDPKESVIHLPDESEPEVEPEPTIENEPVVEEPAEQEPEPEEAPQDEDPREEEPVVEEPEADDWEGEPAEESEEEPEAEAEVEGKPGEPAVEPAAPSTPVGKISTENDGLDDDPEFESGAADALGDGSFTPQGGLPATTDLIDQKSSDTDKDERFRAKMRSIDDEPKVAMFGFKQSGKSWLLHRLRRHLYRDLGAQLDPRHTELPEAGVSLPGTSEFEFHEVIDKYPWSIIDSPGEYSKNLIEGRVESLWQFVHVLAKSSAIIITIPADVLVFGSQMYELYEDKAQADADRRAIAIEACRPGASAPEIKAIEDFLRELNSDFLKLLDFGEGLYRAAGALSYVRQNDIDALDPAQYSGVTWEGTVKPHVKSGDFKPIGGMSGLACPVYIALTKTDRLVSVLFGDEPIPGVSDVINKRKDEMLTWPETMALRAIAERGDLLEDPTKYPLSRPSTFVKALEKAVHKRLVEFCPMSHFDFVSAFFGHDYSTELQFGHYRKYPDFGIDSMQQWIKRAIALSEKGDKRISRQSFARQLHFKIHGIPEPGAGSVKKYNRK